MKSTNLNKAGDALTTVAQTPRWPGTKIKAWLTVLSFFGLLWITPLRADSDLAQAIFEGMPQPKNFRSLINEVSKRLEERYGVPFEPTIEAIDGRSLDEDHDSIQFPRRLIAFVAKQTPNQSKEFVPVFIGYAPTAEQIEVIAMTSGSKGYDFHVIPNFKKQNTGKTMTLGPSEKELCTTCHQGNGPIFSKFPWSETEGSNEDNVFSRDLSNAFPVGIKFLSEHSDEQGVRKASLIIGSSSPLNTKDLSPTEIELSEFADPERSLSGRPFAFDSEVRSANRGAQAARICHDLCKSGTSDQQVKCRKGLFYFSVRKSLIDQALTEEDRALVKSLLPIWKKNWPQDNFAYPSSVLPDRILRPGTDGETVFTLKDIADVYSQQDATSEITQPIRIPGYRTNLFTSAGESYLHPGSPRFPRPDIEPVELDPGGENILIQGSSGQSALSAVTELGAPYCFGLPHGNPTRLLRQKSSMELYDALFKESTLDPLFNTTSLPDGMSLLSALGLSPLGETEATACTACLLISSFPDIMATAKLTAPIVDAATTPELKSNSPTSSLAQSPTKICSSCHDKESRIKLPLGDLKALADYRDEDGQTVAERLRTGDMPPRRKRSRLANQLGISEDQIASTVADLAAQLDALNSPPH